MRDFTDKTIKAARSVWAVFALASTAACTSLPRNPSNATTLPELVKATCVNADMILIGDTDHINNSIHAAVATSAFSKTLQHCGVTKRFDETSIGFASTVVEFEAGKITRREFAKAYDGAVYNYFNVPEKDFKEGKKLQVEIMANAKKHGMHFIPADPLNGAVDLTIYQMVVQAQLDYLEKSLPAEERPYFQLWLKKRDSEIPADKLSSFNQHLEAAASTPKALQLNEAIEKYHKGFDERHDDGGTIGIIEQNLKPGEKGMIMYGQAHMKTPGDLSDRLAQKYRVVRIDIFDSVTNIQYKPEDVKPDYAYALREKRTVVFDEVDGPFYSASKCHRG